MQLHLWQSPSSEVTFYCEAPSKYIVVRKFMKKQCVAAPVAKKLAKKSVQLFMVLLFQWNLLLHFSYLIYISKKEETRLIVEFFPCVVLVFLRAFRQYCFRVHIYMNISNGILSSIQVLKFFFKRFGSSAYFCDVVSPKPLNV